jgi:cytochrome P450
VEPAQRALVAGARAAGSHQVAAAGCPAVHTAAHRGPAGAHRCPDQRPAGPLRSNGIRPHHRVCGPVAGGGDRRAARGAHELRPHLRPWSNRIVALYELGFDDATAGDAVAAATEFTAALHELIAWRRREPGDDLLSALVHARVDGDALTDDELVATAALLLNAGHEASVNVIGNGLVALLRSPEQLDRLRADPRHCRDAIDEMIRYDTPLSLFQRTVFAAMEIAGRRLEPGDRVGLLLGSANRDPDVFAAPDQLDLWRTPNPHVGFGAGIHYCLGAPLARMEGAVALEQLLARAADIELLAPPTRRRSFQFRGYSRAMVRMTLDDGSRESVSKRQITH